MKLLEQNHVKYGLIMCAVILACLIYMSITGVEFSEKSPIVMLFTFIAPFIIWFLGIKEYKKSLKGKMTFKQGTIQGFKISLVYATVSPFIFMVFYFINPSLLEYARTAYGLTTATDNVVIAVDMLIQFVAAIVGGTVYGAILSIFLKSKK